MAPVLNTSPAECAIAQTFGAPPSLETHISAEPLSRSDERAALAFLAERPLHTVIMASFIRDNGLKSPLNRGTFYACRDEKGRLDEESGVDPREVDPEGFRARTARRVGQGRTWVVISGGRLAFKAEVQSETTEVVYLEGVYVAPSERGRGFGSRCLSQLSLSLLGRAPSICLLVNERNREAHDLYRRVGFRFRCVYDTIFLQRKDN
ncbi:MAG: GNAT family N-acetyltransferase [Acidobacteria bacterium]|nr:GNAT family N-acetyltransferase [Acidobacteriota bacterium]